MPLARKRRMRPKVSPMAASPPTTTRAEDLTTGARPSTAPTTPNAASASVATATTTATRSLYPTMNPAASSGSSAPTEKARAEAAAACTGLGSALSSSPPRLPSRSSCAISTSRWEQTDTNSPMAMLHAPASRPANPEITMARTSCFTAPTPSISDAVDTSPSLAPSTAARSQLARPAKSTSESASPPRHIAPGFSASASLVSFTAMARS
ncbi:hypothetical protein VPH35_033099 [Triticum aestivum]